LCNTLPTTSRKERGTRSAKNPESTNIGQATILNEAGKRIYNGNNGTAAGATE